MNQQTQLLMASALLKVAATAPTVMGDTARPVVDNMISKKSKYKATKKCDIIKTANS